jgi:hypothetical protein
MSAEISPNSAARVALSAPKITAMESDAAISETCLLLSILTILHQRVIVDRSTCVALLQCTVLRVLTDADGMRVISGNE